jgi:hypothetical protein
MQYLRRARVCESRVAESGCKVGYEACISSERGVNGHPTSAAEIWRAMREARH